MESERGQKRIELSFHAQSRALLRGATEEEVFTVLREAEYRPAKRGKWRATQRFEFGRPSPINGVTYVFKTVDVIFAEETDRLVVLTIKVYYHNE